MAFSVGDFQDLLRLLGEHPEWRDELRRHILTEELLALPAVVQQQAARMDQFGERMDQLTARMDQLAERMDQLAARMDQLAARMDQLTERMDQLAAAQIRTETWLASLDGRVGTLEGEMLELRYARLGPAYFSRLARRLRVIEPGTLADLLDDAVDEGRLTEAEREAVLRADLVLSGRRREDQMEVYLLAEVSAGIGHSDVERAADRAALLSRLGRPVVAVVAGRRINSEAEDLARSLGVTQVLDGLLETA